MATVIWSKIDIAAVGGAESILSFRYFFEHAWMFVIQNGRRWLGVISVAIRIVTLF